ncbi:GNAT family N-acetyltransferase [Pseudomonas oryzihabitans]|uniref:GNAT family N-acetyltransferase n=1 Tax=Pseudomonas oryzihabitans TaxID=47885 RepID=UPI00285BF1B0|nr:GNAT family N-acetyltransferase [Pseudomonas psychrotolerans]MDR6675978.1 ribosomal protein S18 acetylase RimI-like enzyme [Pseudomonas psychrotolerans]
MSSSLLIERLDAPGCTAYLDDLQGLLSDCVALGASIGFILPLADAASRAFWTDTVIPGVEKGTRLLFAAKRQGRVVGSVQLLLDTPANQPHRAEVAKLLVHPEQRRQGIARALMLALEDAARTQGRELLTLDTRSDDHAEPLYLSLGYTVAGRIPGYALDAVQTTRRDSTTLMYKTLPARPAKLGALHPQESC